MPLTLSTTWAPLILIFVLYHISYGFLEIKFSMIYHKMKNSMTFHNSFKFQYFPWLYQLWSWRSVWSKTGHFWLTVIKSLEICPSAETLVYFVWFILSMKHSVEWLCHKAAQKWHLNQSSIIRNLFLSRIVGIVTCLLFSLHMAWNIFIPWEWLCQGCTESYHQ